MSGKSFLLPNLKLNIFRFLLIGCFGWVMISCQSNPNPKNIQLEIIAAEAAFEKMAAEKSIAHAFYEFADQNATINRGELIHGREAILDFYKKAGLDKARLQWAPDSVFVSEAGDMAYTYGKYKMNLPDSSGQIITKTGIFHTVWKRQADGSWKYVWD